MSSMSHLSCVMLTLACYWQGTKLNPDLLALLWQVDQRHGPQPSHWQPTTAAWHGQVMDMRWLLQDCRNYCMRTCMLARMLALTPCRMDATREIASSRSWRAA